MNNPPSINAQAGSILLSLSRFWQFKRKKLTVQLQACLDDAQDQLDDLFRANQLLTTQNTEQSKRIAFLESSNNTLANRLQTESASLVSTAQALKQEKNRCEMAMQALEQAHANIKIQTEREARILRQITELEEFLEDHRNQLISKEQSLSLLENLTAQLKTSHQHLTENYADINKQHLSLSEKFTLVSSVLAQQPPINEALTRFNDLINHDYMKFASRESSLAGEAQALLDIQAILAEMRMLNNFPSIVGKTILSVAGGFSSGKSAFLNSFIHDKSVRLATGINPVTVVPSYVVCSEETQIKGYSYNGGAIDLDANLYKSMCHEYVQAFGFDLRRILPYISVKVPMDEGLFGNLCIIDTPGYNPGSLGGTAASDRSTAVSLVNQASALVWLIGLDPAGTINQSDIEFIESTPFRSKSLYIVLNKADVRSQEDILEIMEQVADDLSFAGIEYAGMCAYSSTSKREYPSKGLTFDQFLRSINVKVDVVGKITNKLDAVFNAYKMAIKNDITLLQRQKNKFNSFKLDAMELGGTELFDRIDRALPQSEQMFNYPELIGLLNECESLHDKLKLAAREALDSIGGASF